MAQAQTAQKANDSIRVEIYDQGYTLRGTDPDYIEKLAEYVDLKMRAVAEKTSTVDSLRVAVLVLSALALGVPALAVAKKPPDAAPKTPPGQTKDKSPAKSPAPRSSQARAEVIVVSSG